MRGASYFLLRNLQQIILPCENMKSLFKKSCFLLCFFLFENAKSAPISIPGDDKQRLSIENLNFKGSTFIEAYLSTDLTQRRLAEMYLIGVLDAGEGIKWCGYNLALPGSIQEQVYLGFKKLPPNSLNQRASEIIASILSKTLPCKHKL